MQPKSDLTRRALLAQLAAAATLVLPGCGGPVSSGSDRDAGGADPDEGPDAGPDALLRDAPGPGEDASEIPDGARVEGGAPVPPMDPEALAEAAVSFPLGVLAGDALADAAVTTTRFAGVGSLEPGLYVVELDEAGAPARVAFDGPVTPDADGYAHFDVTGLSPFARHRYAFVLREGGRAVRRSRVGHFRTAPAADAQPVVRFGGTSCTKQMYRPFPALGHAAARTDLDFFMHAGDHTYCDGARTLEDFRAKYRENWTDPTLAAIHANAGGYNTWDDHEIDNNFNPETFDRAALAAGYRAFFEHLPLRRDPANPQRLWRSFRWGRTLELFVLDGRSERRPSTRRTADATYLSRAQLDWLKSSLAASPAVFKLVLNSVPIADFPLAFALGADGRWEGFAAQRTELLDFIARSTTGVVFLSGDYHLGSVGRVASSGAHAMIPEILMGPGGQLGNPLAGTLRPPQWAFATAENNYGSFEADPSTRTLSVALRGAAGRVLYEGTVRV